MALSNQDIAILVVIAAVGGAYLLYNNNNKKSTLSENTTSTISNGIKSGTQTPDTSYGRDFILAMEKAKKKLVIFYGSQTGTAEDYGTRIAKEAKARYGLSSLVLDPEDFDFENLDAVPEDSLVVFCVATYGEGEPTDNAVGMMEFLKEDPQFSKSGGLENLNYVIFSLGNSTYEQFCQVGRDLDAKLLKLGAKRIGEMGEGDDDKSMEEDYLSWKDPMWEQVQRVMGWEEGAGGDVNDFEVTELTADQVDKDKLYLGELSQRALSGTRGVFDAKNPYAAPLLSSKELFSDGDRNCIFAEFNIADSGIRYQTGDHVGIWPLNPSGEVEKFLSILGLEGKAYQPINVKSLDPALAKVPFPVPTTYDTVFRHYLDICSVASRQTVGSLAKFAPNEAARIRLEQLGSNKELYHKEVAEKCLKLSEVLILSAGDSLSSDPSTFTKWNIPLDRIISGVSRLQPRYYSISSSPKLFPNAIHVTAVVLKYTPDVNSNQHVFGVGTNYLLNLKTSSDSSVGSREADAPQYKLEGPRGKYKKESAFAAPIHVRRSNFRLPTSPKIPIIMIGPGTGVAPFRAFVQERVALARKAKDKDGPDALKDWGTIDLFYGCRRSDWDYLYRDEWVNYAAELDGKFRIHTALSREPGQPKVYVQELIGQQATHIADALIDKKGYAFICGDAKHMAKAVEHQLEDILGNAKGGGRAEGVKELKLLKDRNRLLLDVWS